MIIIFTLLFGIALFFTILFSIKKVVEEAQHYSKRDANITFRLEKVSKHKK